MSSKRGGAGIYRSKVLLIDFGSQYTTLLARRVREQGVYCEIVPHTITKEAIFEEEPAALILSGGPGSVVEGGKLPVAPLFHLGVPILGVCYGMQVMAQELGGTVKRAKRGEYGHADLFVERPSGLLTENMAVWMSHHDIVDTMPPGFISVAKTEGSPIAAMIDEERALYGVQFHPEVTHTPEGKALMRRFLFEIAGCEALWNACNVLQEIIEEVRRKVGRERVILALSGGLDSSVLAALLHKAIGDQLVCLFVDTGYLRWEESKRVRDLFAKQMGIKVAIISAAARFIAALKGVEDPEEKRKIVGREFIAVFDEEAMAMEGIGWLAQGTIYPDVIESAGGDTTGGMKVIKSHHNVAGLPSHVRFRLLEPLRELFKDEVREVGRMLGLPDEILSCHPFPGPGLCVRILGEAKEEYTETLRRADAIFLEELRLADLYHKVDQAFAVFLPVKSVGVVGDSRRYAHVIALRAVETTDFMTARWASLPADFLGKVGERIVNEVDAVSRVVYDITGKPPATIEWE